MPPSSERRPSPVKQQPGSLASPLATAASIRLHQHLYAAAAAAANRHHFPPAGLLAGSTSPLSAGPSTQGAPASRLFHISSLL